MWDFISPLIVSMGWFFGLLPMPASMVKQLLVLVGLSYFMPKLFGSFVKPAVQASQAVAEKAAQAVDREIPMETDLTPCDPVVVSPGKSEIPEGAEEEPVIDLDA